MAAGRGGSELITVNVSLFPGEPKGTELGEEIGKKRRAYAGLPLWAALDQDGELGGRGPQLWLPGDPR